jgi:hypothetical protein
MKISSSLLKPSVRLLQLEFQSLKQNAGFRQCDESARLSAFIEKQMRDLEQLSAEISALDHTQESCIPEHVYSNFKAAKHNLRISSRTWSRIISNEARNRKQQEKSSNVATFAA